LSSFVGEFCFLFLPYLSDFVLLHLISSSFALSFSGVALEEQTVKGATQWVNELADHCDLRQQASRTVEGRAPTHQQRQHMLRKLCHQESPGDSYFMPRDYSDKITRPRRKAKVLSASPSPVLAHL
jgi:hypothetical protein